MENEAKITANEAVETDWRINYLNATCYAYATINEMDAALKGRHFVERKQIIADKCFDMIELLIDDLHGGI
jgi:hypothetical protein